MSFRIALKADALVNFAHQLRQLGDVRRDPSRVVFREPPTTERRVGE
jgi:hypothetical protein